MSSSVSSRLAAGEPAGAVEPGSAGEELTIDQLATRTGMTVRTVRFYATEGLLPAPQRRGRQAFYGPQHRLRLDLIRTLQEHGYTLAAVERVLQRIPEDAHPAEFAVHSAVLAPWLPDGREELDRADLERRLGRPLSDDEVDFLVEVGAVERLDAAGEVVVERFRAAPDVLGHAGELLALPVPVRLLRDSARIIDDHATAVANGLTDVFAEAIWAPYQRGELDHEQVVAILGALRPLALRGLVSAFGRAADRAARRRLEPDRSE